MFPAPLLFNLTSEDLCGSPPEPLVRAPPGYPGPLTSLRQSWLHGQMASSLLCGPGVPEGAGGSSSSALSGNLHLDFSDAHVFCHWLTCNTPWFPIDWTLRAKLAMEAAPASLVSAPCKRHFTRNSTCRLPSIVILDLLSFHASCLPGKRICSLFSPPYVLTAARGSWGCLEAPPALRRTHQVILILFTCPVPSLSPSAGRVILLSRVTSA